MQLISFLYVALSMLESHIEEAWSYQIAMLGYPYVTSG